MTPEGRTIFEARLRQQLGASLAQSGAAVPAIKIRIDYYRMRHGAARATLQRSGLLLHRV